MNVDQNEWVNILLVDDDEDCRMLVRDAIAQGNIDNEVYDVGSAEEALDFLHHQGAYPGSPEIGLIYLDIQMPGMNGQELLKVLRTEPAFQSVPVVMLTSLQDDREKETAAQSGANSYNVKPADPVEFTNTIIETTKYWVRVHQHPHKNTSHQRSTASRT